MAFMTDLAVKIKVEDPVRGDRRKYGVVYMDPPWKYNARANHNTRFRDGAGGHYPLMTMEEIKAIPIQKIADESCALFMWCTFPYIEGQLQLFEHWGFKYRTLAFNWTKLNPVGYELPEMDPRFKEGKYYVLYTDGLYHSVFFGVGFYSKSNPEVCLLGIKGGKEPYSDSVSSVVLAPRREHSRKPDEVAERIEIMYPNDRKIELFSRYTRPGWDYTGWDLDGKDILMSFNDIGIPPIRSKSIQETKLVPVVRKKPASLFDLME